MILIPQLILKSYYTPINLRYDRRRDDLQPEKHS